MMRTAIVVSPRPSPSSRRPYSLSLYLSPSLHHFTILTNRPQRSRRTDHAFRRPAGRATALCCAHSGRSLVPNGLMRLGADRQTDRHYRQAVQAVMTTRFTTRPVTAVTRPPSRARHDRAAAGQCVVYECSDTRRTRDTIECADSNVPTEGCYKTSMTSADQARPRRQLSSSLNLSSGMTMVTTMIGLQTCTAASLLQYTLHILLFVYCVVFSTSSTPHPDTGPSLPVLQRKTVANNVSE